MTLEKIIKNIVAIYNRNSIFKFDMNSPALTNDLNCMRELFSNYACADFAYATHLTNNWDVFQIDFYKNDTDGYAPYHMVNKKPGTDLYFDVNGFFTLDELITKFNGATEFTEVNKVEPCPLLVSSKTDIAVISKFSSSRQDKFRPKQI